jgi:lysophospholipase L1-like esterase
VRVRPALAACLAACCLSACGTTSPPVTTSAPPGVPVVVTLGDSVPAGTDCDCDPFPDVYARGQNAVSENLAAPGYTSADVRAQLAGVRTALAAADEVLLMIGANDLAQAFDDDSSFAGAAGTMRANVTATISTIEAIHRTTVIVLGYWNVVQDGRVGVENYGPSGVRAAASATTFANDALMTAARETGATYVSTGEAFHGADGSQDPTGLLAPDGDHPNAAGHAAIAALIPPLAGPYARARSTPLASPTRSGPG